MSDALAILALTLAAYRVWRLLGVDLVTEGLRDRLTGPAGIDRPVLHDMIACAWCAGSWVSFAAVAGLWAFRPLPLPALWFGAVAAGVGIAHAVVERLEGA